jgi:hypothetical protein
MCDGVHLLFLRWYEPDQVKGLSDHRFLSQINQIRHPRHLGKLSTPVRSVNIRLKTKAFNEGPGQNADYL